MATKSTELYYETSKQTLDDMLAYDTTHIRLGRFGLDAQRLEAIKRLANFAFASA